MRERLSVILPVPSMNLMKQQILWTSLYLPEPAVLPMIR